MEKLIELLNEYEELSPSRLQRKYYSESWHIMYIDEEWEDVDDYRTDYEIISKEYGFIKWLVDNDKIDMKKHFYDKMNCVWYPDLNIVLCELAVSDTPIDDLISYLR